MKSENLKPKRTRNSAETSETILSAATGATQAVSPGQTVSPAEASPRKAPRLVSTTRQSSAVGVVNTKVQNGGTAGNGSKAQVTDDQIRERAYHLFLERGGRNGSREDDWYRAEAELRGYKH